MSHQSNKYVTIIGLHILLLSQGIWGAKCQLLASVGTDPSSQVRGYGRDTVKETRSHKKGSSSDNKRRKTGKKTAVVAAAAALVVPPEPEEIDTALWDDAGLSKVRR